MIDSKVDLLIWGSVDPTTKALRIGFLTQYPAQVLGRPTHDFNSDNPSKLQDALGSLIAFVPIIQFNSIVKLDDVIQGFMDFSILNETLNELYERARLISDFKLTATDENRCVSRYTLAVFALFSGFLRADRSRLGEALTIFDELARQPSCNRFERPWAMFSSARGVTLLSLTYYSRLGRQDFADLDRQSLLQTARAAFKDLDSPQIDSGVRSWSKMYLAEATFQLAYDNRDPQLMNQAVAAYESAMKTNSNEFGLVCIQVNLANSLVIVMPRRVNKTMRFERAKVLLEDAIAKMTKLKFGRTGFYERVKHDLEQISDGRITSWSSHCPFFVPALASNWVPRFL